MFSLKALYIPLAQQYVITEQCCCNCIPAALLVEIQLCSTVCVIHKNSLLLSSVSSR